MNAVGPWVLAGGVRARRLWPLVVALAGVVASIGAVSIAREARKSSAEQADRRAVIAASAIVGERLRTHEIQLRGPAAAFEVSSLRPEGLSGLLRLAYAQATAFTVVTMLDESGRAVVPAAFLSRGGRDRTAESLDELERFSREIPLREAITSGRAVRGPYAALRGGFRLAVAEALAVEDGTRTWVFAAEVELESLRNTGTPALDGELIFVGDGVLLGLPARIPDDCLMTLRALSRRPSAQLRNTLHSGPGWRLAIAQAPGGMQTAVGMLWIGDPPGARSERVFDASLLVLIWAVIGAAAAALGASLRAAEDFATPSNMRANDAALGAIIKELANPVSAAGAAAKVLAKNPTQERVREALVRAALRTERMFRRVARLLRAGEERPSLVLEFGAIVRREVEAARSEFEQNNVRIECVLEEKTEVRSNDEDLALLVQAVLDGARALAPPDSVVDVVLKNHELKVTDHGAATVAEREALLRLESGTRTELAAAASAWALCLRLAEEGGGTCTIVPATNGASLVVRLPTV